MEKRIPHVVVYRDTIYGLGSTRDEAICSFDNQSSGISLDACDVRTISVDTYTHIACTPFYDTVSAKHLLANKPVSTEECCCFGYKGHDGACCDGYFFNEETSLVERCDDCRKFADDDAATVAHDAAISVVLFEDPSDASVYPDSGETMTLGAFLAANPTLDAEAVAELRTLAVGHEYHGGGGASADWMIRRLA